MTSHNKFRNWLVQKLAQTTFAFYKEESDEDLARRIGVQPDVIRDARIVFAERMRAIGMPEGQQKLGRRLSFRDNKHYVCLEPPREIYEDWQAICQQRKVTEPTLFRSVVHATLKLTTQPKRLSIASPNQWLTRTGKWVGQENIRLHLYRLYTNINEASHQALLRRAEYCRCKPSAIARWGVNLFVHGKLPSVFIVQVKTAMYKKPEHYCLEPELTED